MGTFIKKLAKFDKSLKIKKKGITITISGLSGAGKTTIAKEIAKVGKLKLVNSGDIFRQIAKEKKMPLEQFSKIRKPEIDYELDKRTIKLAKEGNVVIVGRIAGYAAGDYADWKIFVDCALDIRAKRVAKREGKSVTKAKKDIEKRDKADADHYWKLYKIDDTDKKIYDIVINTSYLTKKETIQLARNLAQFLVRN